MPFRFARNADGRDGGINQFGEIVDIRFPSLKYNTHRRFCYVQFSSAEAAQAATSLDGTQLGEKEHLVAKISAPDRKKERTSATGEGREVYIRNIDFQAKESDLREIFGKYGKIEKVRLPPGPKKGTHKGFGFIIFATKEDADASLIENGTQLKSRNLDVSIAQLNPTKFKPGNAVATTPAGEQPNGDAKHEASPPPSFEQIKKKTLGIMNLSDTVNDTRLRTLFEHYGPLRKLTLRPDHQGAIVEYENVADAGKASLAMEGKDLDGMQIQIGTLEDLMKQTPVAKTTKGFQKKPAAVAPALIPASVRNAGRGGRGGGAAGVRKRGLGFMGAMSKKDSTTTTADVEMRNAADEKKGKSNDEFKRMYLAER
jgi:RNA recognition motif-containing protein